MTQDPYSIIQLGLNEGVVTPTQRSVFGYITDVADSQGRFEILADKRCYQGSCAGAMYPLFTTYKFIKFGKIVFSKTVHVTDLYGHAAWRARQIKWFVMLMKKHCTLNLLNP